MLPIPDEGPPDCTIMSGLWNSSYFEMTALSNAEQYRIFIGGPNPSFFAGDAEQDARCPVILVLDAKLNFALVHAQVQIMNSLGQLPPAYVVGIGYAGDESFFEKDAIRRQADLTPSRGGEREAQTGTNNRASGVGHGGANAFLAFLECELLPRLQATYPIMQDDRTIVGHSLGGLFSSWVLFHRPQLFNRYVVVSPSWWWNEYEIWRWEAAYAAVHADLSARVFVTFGGLETATNHRKTVERAMNVADGELKKTLADALVQSDQHGWAKGVELIPEFLEIITQRHYPGLDLTTLMLPDENHESIPGAAFSRGLRAVFGSWKSAPTVHGDSHRALRRRRDGADADARRR
ncbi:alpha/beta hydrolase [Sphingosinicella soli]|uniref:Putative alpha/beta superfamily hydrolase n=1 Tax=Sphingosinicella soli TaxID=333708 RepID=A0A7W7AYX9_9SPHN|nr:alpha/beta hydrolase-fold protein [Sphingosinicella soli]MBB4630912.1 putative alpha/beta superfamily hydrolase [Sphingosinicella soli]